jgi:2-polyprenyl-3-methyl-5-hydroxy-6-metoxy-1,4-benzoquinol methylase
MKPRHGVICKVCKSPSRYAYMIESSNGASDLMVFRCTYCRLLFIGTPVTSRALESAYESLDTDAYYEQVGETTSAKVARALSDLRPLLLTTSKDPAVLDVGCGYGHLLEALRNQNPALRIAGTELPGASADVCRAKNLKVFTCDIQEIEERFSAVVLLDVAEHLAIPNRTFAECNAVLNCGGYIYLHTPRICFWDEISLALVRVPLFSSLARLWLRTRISIFHLQLWSDEALKISLNQAGFDPVYMHRELELSWPLRRYVETYLARRMRFPSPLIWLVTTLASLILVRLGTLRNKAICLAQKQRDVV